MKTTERIPVDFTWSAKTEPDHCRVFALMSTTAKSVAQQWRHRRRFLGVAFRFKPPTLFYCKYYEQPVYCGFIRQLRSNQIWLTGIR